MTDWIASVYQAYWPAILIFAGLAGAVWGILSGNIFECIFNLVFWAGLGVLFFVYSPQEAWTWLNGFTWFNFLVSGAWYEVLLKVTGAIGAVQMITKILLNF